MECYGGVAKSYSYPLYDLAPCCGKFCSPQLFHEFSLGQSENCWGGMDALWVRDVRRCKCWLLLAYFGIFGESAITKSFRKQNGGLEVGKVFRQIFYLFIYFCGQGFPQFFSFCLILLIAWQELRRCLDFFLLFFIYLLETNMFIYCMVNTKEGRIILPRCIIADPKVNMYVGPQKLRLYAQTNGRKSNL